LIAPGTGTEPAILHAIVAVSAAHRTNVRRRQGLPDVQDYFALRQYTKAIRLLQPLLANADRTSAMVVLVACLLFTSLEYLRGQHKVAALHLQTGLRLLKEAHFERAEMVHGVLIIRPATYNRVTSSAIVQGFASLHVQANLFGNHIPDVSLILQVTDTEIPSPRFASLHEARDSMDKLLHGIVLLAQRVRAAMNGVAEWSPTFVQSQNKALSHLTRWRTTFENSRMESGSENKSEAMTCSQLLNYHTMATIMCESMFSAYESTYLEHTDKFITIIERSTDPWKYLTSPQHIEQSGIAVDIASIPPLYYTALKCRMPRIRAHAIRLLRSVPLKEGIWDPNVAANVAEKVKRSEEQYYKGRIGLEHKFALDDVPFLSEWERTFTFPETALFHEIQVDLSNSRSVLLTCHKSEHHDKIIQRYRFDGERWHDVKLLEFSS
jgi:hypothetical protein